MSGPAAGLNDQDLQRVGDYVRSNLSRWLTEVAPQVFVGPQLLERMTRVEEQIKAQGELMVARFEAVDRRFEAVEERFKAIDERFEASDRRFDDMIRYMDKRFDAVDKRFEAVDKRFEASDRRFDDMVRHMDKRFSLIQWMVGAGFTALVLMMSVHEFMS